MTTELVEAEQRIARLEKINAALMARVERGMNLEEGGYSLFQAATALETEVRERTSTLEATLLELKRSNEQLKTARDLADAANRAKSEFLANMSHEIRTPMNGVLGMLELMMAAELGAPQRRMANTIRRSAESLLSIINDILDYSKIEAGHLDVSKVEFDVRAVVSECADTLVERAQRKGVGVVVHVSADAGATYVGDPARIRQILTNLIGNAVKFTAKGEVVVRVSSNRDNERVRFSVLDTGMGIPEKSRQLIFQPFRQADSASTRGFEGTGLGLAIAKRLVEVMGGEIGVQSKLGAGSTFWFELPLELSAPRVLPSLASAVRPRVLLAEDSEAVISMVRDYTSSWGVEIVAVSTAEDALARIRDASATHEFAAVLVDDSLVGAERIAGSVRLPVLRLNEPYSDLRGVSGASTLSKPLRCDALHRALQLLLSGRKAGSSATVQVPLMARMSLSGLRILVAEDNLVNQQVARGFLEGMGCSVTTANNGREAFELWESTPFDLVLMDWHMPEVDGLAATRLIREREATSLRPRTPVIALTASAMIGDQERCLSAQMDDFLAKPFSGSALRAVVERWSSGGQGDAWLPPGAQPAVDVTVLDDLTQLSRPGQSDFVPGLIRTYLNQSRAGVTEMLAMVQRGDSVGVRALCHKLKASSAVVGAGELTVLLQRGEQLAEDEPSSLEGIVHDIARAATSAERFLSEFLRRGSVER